MLKQRRLIVHAWRAHPLVLLALLVGLLLLSLPARAALQPAPLAASGPGVPRLTFTSSQLFTTLSRLDADNRNAPGFHGFSFMHDGYLVLMRSGTCCANGGFNIYNITDPRNPVLVRKVDRATQREGHTVGLANLNGRSYIAMLASRGINIWDFTDGANPTLVREFIVPNITASDYDTGAWWLAWQAPYIYLAGASTGLHIIDAADPANPIIKKTISNASLGTSFRAGSLWVVGNLMTIAMQDNSGFATFDISDPLNPQLLARNTTAVSQQYASLVNGNKLYLMAKDSSNPTSGVVTFDINNPSSPTRIASLSFGSGGGYALFQDGYLFEGASQANSGLFKVDVRTNTYTIAGRGPLNTAQRDPDFLGVFGNLAIASDDDGDGSVLFAHQTTPDSNPPAVNMVSPRNNTVNVKLSSRIGLTLTDQADMRSVSASTFSVRPVGGTALAGRYSGQQGVLNFWPSSPLAANTTYEVIVNGLRDFAGNPMTTQFRSLFSTGPAIDTAPTGCNIGVDTPALVGASVSFNVTGCSGTGNTYSWEFGDGTSTAFSSATSASHTYASPDHYTVILKARNSGGQTNFDRIQTVTYAVTSPRPTGSSTIVYDSARSLVHSVNPDSNTVSAINASTNGLLYEAPVGRHPRTLALASNGDLWVVNQDDANISVLNGATGARITTIPLPRGSRPYGIAFNPAGTQAYVTLEALGRLLRIDPTTRTISGNIDVGAKPRGIAVSGNGARIFVTRFISPEDNGEVREVSASTFSVVRTFVLAESTTPSSESDGPGYPNYLQSVVISPDGRKAWVPSKKDNSDRGTGPGSDGLLLGTDSTVRTIISQLDLLSNSESPATRIDINNADMADAAVFSPLGDYIYVATQGTNRVSIFDALNSTPIGAIDGVGLAPQGLAINPAGSRLYVQNFMSRDVAIYDVSQTGKGNLFSRLALVDTVATELLAPKVLQGKQIFYNAADQRMSLEGYIACASCHVDGLEDGRVWDFTQRGEGVRNTISLLGRAGMGQGVVHWSGNFDEIQDFEHDIRSAFGGTGFMTDAQFNTGTRKTPLGDKKAGISSSLDALAIYVSSLNKVNPSPFRNADGSMTAAAVAGEALFRSSGLGCITCHAGNQLSDSGMGFNFHDVGTLTSASGQRLGAPLTGLDTPTLKGIWENPPYLHDGSAASIRDVVTTKNPGNRHGNTTQLTSAQVDQLVAYLQQVDDTPATIRSLSVQDSANAARWSIEPNLQPFVSSHGDRGYMLSSMPSALAGLDWIRPANDSKSFTGATLVSFSLPRQSDVLVAWNDALARPAWLDASWTDSGNNLVVEASGTLYTMSLYQKNFDAGTVALGPYNSASGVVYLTVVRPGGPGPTPTPTRTSTSGPSATPTRTSTSGPSATPTRTSTPGTCLTATNGGAWQNSSFASQSGSFTAEFDATPSASPNNAVAGLSLGAQSAYTGLATMVRFNSTGSIDARNGGVFAAGASIPYSANQSYHVRMVVNVPAHTYSIFITPPGGGEQLLGSNYAFRTEQNTVASLNNLSAFVGGTGATGSLSVCNFSLGASATPTATRTRTPTATGVPALSITNLNVRDTANPEWSLQTNLQNGNTAFGDRAYTIEALPASLAGSQWIRPAADSKAYTGNPLVSFSISRQAEVSLALDDRAARPSWLDGSWVDSALNLNVRETSTTVRAYSIYRKTFAAGTVSLGPLGADTAPTYLTIVR